MAHIIAKLFLTWRVRCRCQSLNRFLVWRIFCHNILTIFFCLTPVASTPGNVFDVSVKINSVFWSDVFFIVPAILLHRIAPPPPPQHHQRPPQRHQSRLAAGQSHHSDPMSRRRRHHRWHLCRRRPRSFGNLWVGPQKLVGGTPEASHQKAKIKGMKAQKATMKGNESPKGQRKEMKAHKAKNCKMEPVTALINPL